MRVALVVLVIALVARIAPAARATTVAIVRPEAPGPAAAETIVRLQGELTSVGFESTTVSAPEPIEPDEAAARATLERLATRLHVDAVVALRADKGRPTVAVVAVDHARGKVLARNVTFDAEAEPTPSTVAIRAMELLRASLIELNLWAPAPVPPRANASAPTNTPATGSPPGAAVAPATLAVKAPATEPAAPFSVELGAAVMTSFDGVGPAVAPLLRGTWAVRGPTLIALTAVGRGTEPAVRSLAGSADLIQDALVLSAGRRFRVEHRLQPVLTLGAGALRTAVDGHGEATNQGHRAAQWSLLIDAGLGVDARLGSRFFVAAAAHAQWAEPYVAVRLVDDVVATTAHPNVMFTLALGAGL